MLWLLSLATAALAVEQSAPDPIALRDLHWGQLNFLHTTDSHGWLAGHLQEPSYSADWGDYVSFTTRMREEADARGADLLVIDTGDRVEGNGLYDSSEPKGVYLSEILRQQHLDLLSAGNHELYKQDTSEAEFLTTVPNFRDHYLASNLDIIHPDTQEVVPLAQRFKKFTTPNQGIRIAAFGFIFDFTGNANNTIIQPVEKTVKDEWFQEVVRDEEVDLFLVIGHVPLRSKEYKAVLKEIRAVRGNIPIQFFGGHLHVRDYTRYDASAHGLASGRFLETVGFMSIDDFAGQHSTSSSPSFFRRYIDNNLFSFHHHTNLDEDTFPTRHGREVSRLIEHSRNDLGLDEVHGCAPRDLWMSRVKYPSKDSIYTWLEQDVLRSLKDVSRYGHPALAVVNTGAIRFDIFEGLFTQDTTFIISPFTSGFRYVKDIPYDKAQLVVEILNKQPQILDRSPYAPSMVPPQQHAYPNDVDDVLPEAYHNQAPMPGTSRLTPGYTTIDDGGTDGDDTVHTKVPFYRVPNCVHALVSNLSAIPETVDLVYIDFIEPRVVHAAQVAGLDVNFSKESDVYMPSVTLTNLILQWVKDNWKCE